MEDESDANVGLGREAIRGVSDEFPGHGGSIIGDAGKIGVRVRHLGQTEIGKERGVRTKLDIQFGRALGGDGLAEGLDDLASQNRASGGTHSVRMVVGKVVLLGTSESEELMQVLLGQVVQLRSGVGGVVDHGDVDVVKDGVSFLEGHLLIGKFAIKNGRQRVVEILGRVEEITVQRRGVEAVAAGGSFVAVTGFLQPLVILAVGTGRDLTERN